MDADNAYGQMSEMLALHCVAGVIGASHLPWLSVSHAVAALRVRIILNVAELRLVRQQFHIWCICCGCSFAEKSAMRLAISMADKSLYRLY